MIGTISTPFRVPRQHQLLLNAAPRCFPHLDYIHQRGKCSARAQAAGTCTYITAPHTFVKVTYAAWCVLKFRTTVCLKGDPLASSAATAASVFLRSSSRASMIKSCCGLRVMLMCVKKSRRGFSPSPHTMPPPTAWSIMAWWCFPKLGSQTRSICGVEECGCVACASAGERLEETNQPGTQ